MDLETIRSSLAQLYMSPVKYTELMSISGHVQFIRISHSFWVFLGRFWLHYQTDVSISLPESSSLKIYTPKQYSKTVISPSSSVFTQRQRCNRCGYHSSRIIFFFFSLRIGVEHEQCRRRIRIVSVMNTERIHDVGGCWGGVPRPLGSTPTSVRLTSTKTSSVTQQLRNATTT